MFPLIVVSPPTGLTQAAALVRQTESSPLELPYEPEFDLLGKSLLRGCPTTPFPSLERLFHDYYCILICHFALLTPCHFERSEKSFMTNHSQIQDSSALPGCFLNCSRQTAEMVLPPGNHPAVPRDWTRGVPERYVAGFDTRGRPGGWPYRRSQQVIHEICGLQMTLRHNL